MRNSLLISLFIYCLQFCLIETIFFENQVKLRLYRNGYSIYEEERISKAEMLFHESRGYNQTVPIVLIIHGMDTGADCHFVNGLIRAFAKRKLSHKYNIFAVDMPELFEDSFRNQFYFGILANVKPIGDVIGELLSKVVIRQLAKPENINIIGYSMGAQVAGYAARKIKKKVGKISFIAGLDPAGPGFHAKYKGRPALIHVSSADAHITHFYHTNSISCGTRDRVGTADFVFNGAAVQPGCTKEKGIDCSHIRVPYLYIEAVYRPHNFVARKCSSWKKFKSCACNKCKTISITFPPNPRAKGTYYLYTRDKSPFAMKKKGSRCRKSIHKSNKKTTKKHLSVVEREIKPLKDYFLPKYNKKEGFLENLFEGVYKMLDIDKPLVYKEDSENGKKI